MSTTIHVALGARSYPIHIAAGGLSRVGEWMRAVAPGKRVLLVADAAVDALYGEPVAASLAGAGYQVARARVPSGETSKSSEQLVALYARCVEAGLDRSSAIVALGGGVVGDLAGYAAATYLRGIRLVQVPTTLLAMVDSSIGGKTGINLPHGKNLVGSFHQPVLVVCDPDALRSLPARERAAGLAEVIKYGVIRDAALFAFLEQHLPRIQAGESAAQEHVIARSCAIKAEVVAADEHESGERAILNFGHTLAHAIENVAGYGSYLHGEAVGIGMVYAAELSVRLKGFPVPDAARIEALVARAGLPVRAPELAWPALRRAMGVDKKSADGTPRFVLAEAIGRVAYGCTVTESALEEVWHARCQ